MYEQLNKQLNDYADRKRREGNIDASLLALTLAGELVLVGFSEEGEPRYVLNEQN
jgi:hypothetical protein